MKDFLIFIFQWACFQNFLQIEDMVNFVFAETASFTHR